MFVRLITIVSHNNTLYGLDDHGGLWKWIEPLDKGPGKWVQISGGIEREVRHEK